MQNMVTCEEFGQTFEKKSHVFEEKSSRDLFFKFKKQGHMFKEQGEKK